MTGTPSAFTLRAMPAAVKGTLFAVCLLVSVFILAVVLVVVAGAFTRTWGVNDELTWCSSRADPSLGCGCLTSPPCSPTRCRGVVMGLGFAVAFGGRWEWIVLTGTASIILLNHFIRRMPFGIRSGSSALKQIDPVIEEAAADLGARPLYAVRRVALARALVSHAGVLFSLPRGFG